MNQETEDLHPHTPCTREVRSRARGHQDRDCGDERGREDKVRTGSGGRKRQHGSQVLSSDDRHPGTVTERWRAEEGQQGWS